jgi:hypothetical protein
MTKSLELIPYVPDISKVTGVLERNPTMNMNWVTQDRQYDSLYPAKSFWVEMHWYLGSESAIYRHFHILCKQFPSTQWCEMAAKYGYLDVLRLLWRWKFPWDHHTTTNAALYNHPSVLKWAYYKGCPIQQNLLMRNIATSGNVRTMEWAVLYCDLKLTRECLQFPTRHPAMIAFIKSQLGD